MTQQEFIKSQHDLEAVQQELADALGRVEKLNRMLNNSCQEWAEDHTEIQNLARPFGIDVDGDSYGVPGILDIATSLAEQLTAVTKERDELRNYRTGFATQTELRAKAELRAEAAEDALCQIWTWDGSTHPADTEDIGPREVAETTITELKNLTKDRDALAALVERLLAASTQ